MSAQHRIEYKARKGAVLLPLGLILSPLLLGFATLRAAERIPTINSLQIGVATVDIFALEHPRRPMYQLPSQQFCVRRHGELAQNSASKAHFHQLGAHDRSPRKGLGSMS